MDSFSSQSDFDSRLPGAKTLKSGCWGEVNVSFSAHVTMIFSQVLSVVLIGLRKVGHWFLLYQKELTRGIFHLHSSAPTGAQLSSERTVLLKSVLLSGRITKKATKF
jgi:hypothetical protein